MGWENGGVRSRGGVGEWRGEVQGWENGGVRSRGGVGEWRGEVQGWGGRMEG